jgi:DNA mismatch endonuclease (patch repair protein)
MVANRSKNTKPELAVRQMLHALGYRFRVHRRDLPGQPDLSFSARRKVVELRGCYWHGHGCQSIGLLPKSRTEYWGPKIAGNKARDARNTAALRELGWEVLEIWECRLRAAPDEVANELVRFLGSVSMPNRKRKMGMGAAPVTTGSPEARRE